MSNLLASLSTAGNSLGVYQQALDVVQNNITNSSTPGYATQSLNLVAQPFDVAGGLAGGVAARGLQSARDEYADEDVRRQLQTLGRYEAQASGTASIQSQFDVTGTSGVAADLSTLFQSFSAWSVTPNSETAKQSVISGAGTVAADIQQLATSLSSTSQSIQGQITSTVGQINQLASSIQSYNIAQMQHGGTPDPGADANVHSNLEQLSQLANITTVTQADGTINVLLSNGSPLVVGNQAYSLSASQAVPAGAANPGAPPSSQVLDWQGNDITSQIQGGQLGGLLDVHNRVLASILGDGQQAGTLNQFAKSLADTVNGILQSGTVSTASGAANGSPLFVYNSSDPTAAAGSIAVNPVITTGELAPVDASGNSNGNALKLASLDSSTASGGINGSTFGDFFSQIASYAGQENSTATAHQQSQQQVVAQTQALRDQTSGVSLDAQATQLLEFQKDYNATARVITTLANMADTVIALITE